MPVDKQVIQRYKILDKCFRSAEGMTYLELLDTLEDNGIKVDKRTIQNDMVVFGCEYGADFEPECRSSIDNEEYHHVREVFRQSEK